MGVGRTGRTRAGLSPALGVLLLSALWAMDSLRPDLFPGFGADALPSAERQAVLFSIFAVMAAGIAAVRRIGFPRGRQAWACAGVGLGLFAVPAAMETLAQGWVSALDRVAVFSLTPVFAVVLEPYLEGSEPRRGRAALAGALAGVAGILCLFSLDTPGSLRAATALCALAAAALGIAATNCLAVRLARNLKGGSAMPLAALAGAAASGCFIAATVCAPRTAWRWSAAWSELPWLLAVDLPALLLLFWLMRRMAATRMTARFLLAPLLAILAGMALERSAPPLRGWIGMALLAGGAGWLLLARPENTEEEEMVSLKAPTAGWPRQPPPAD